MSENLTHTLKTIKNAVIPPVYSSGWPLIVACVFIALILSLIWDLLGFIGFLISIWCFYFFRSPKRFVPDRDGLIIAPMSGKITNIHPECALPKLLNKAENTDALYTKITIAPSPFDAHMLRFPITGKIVEKVQNHSAAMHSGFNKADEESDHCAILFEVPYKNKTVEMAVMATANGPFPKIICDASSNKKYVTGEPWGHVRFHGRIDLYIPADIGIFKAIGQTLIDGETVLGDLSSKEKSRPAIER
jgi:phosphatidylserine decarboxylase